MTKFTISDKIDDNIVIKLLSIFSSGGKDVMDILKTLSVDVEDRSVN